MYVQFVPSFSRVKSVVGAMETSRSETSVSVSVMATFVTTVLRSVVAMVGVTEPPVTVGAVSENV